MKKMYKYIFLCFLIAFLGYNSVFFKKLSEIKKQQSAAFNFNSFADSLYYKGILKRPNTIDLQELLAQIETNSDSAFKIHGNRLGIGNTAFFMVKGTGKVISIVDGEIMVKTAQNSIVSINTKYIFGNAIRDASGLVKLTDFKTNAEFNKVSEALNTVIREKALPPISKNIQVGNEISFVGALKLSKKEDFALSILPVFLE